MSKWVQFAIWSARGQQENISMTKEEGDTDIMERKKDVRSYG